MVPKERQPRVEGVSLSGEMARQGGSLDHGSDDVQRRTLAYLLRHRGAQLAARWKVSKTNHAWLIVLGYVAQALGLVTGLEPDHRKSQDLLCERVLATWQFNKKELIDLKVSLNWRHHQEWSEAFGGSGRAP